jgi:hypothetical protein
MSNLKQQIEWVLQASPETRNSDIALTLAIWRRFYGEKLRKAADGEEYVRLQNLFDLPREDNVKRIRAKFNAEGKYWPTDLKIARARGILEDQWRVEMGYPTVEDTKMPSKAPSYIQEIEKPKLL